MPKLKTRKAAAKRFKATGTGKFMRRRAFHNHLLDHKTPKQKRQLLRLWSPERVRGGARGRTEGADRVRASASQQESRTAL